MTYIPIENFGIIGNMRSAALVGINGSIDWFCFPYFDSPSIFASILDHQKGGYFKICPHLENYKQKQFYWPDTNILVTRFLSEEGVVEITDFMPVGDKIQTEEDFYIVRRIRGIHGTINMGMQCFPAFDYGRQSHRTGIYEGGAIFENESLTMGLSSTIPLKKNGKMAKAEFVLEENSTVVFIFHKVNRENGSLMECTVEETEKGFRDTIQFWKTWISQSTYQGRWREMVHRSALILKLLTFEPTGAIVAAPTCSLPEKIGGNRNWDYRYTWIRDASFTLYALLRIGFTREASNFMEWLKNICSHDEGGNWLQVMYSIHGQNELTEHELPHLEGYCESAPVRVGNGAHNQLQLDIYGELMDSVYLYDKYGSPISFGLWKSLRGLLDWVCENWHQKDEGIWEVRGGKQHFVFSKLMCWVALDRGIRLSFKRSLPGNHDKWRKERDKIYEEIMEQGWNNTRNAFVQSYGSEILDASTLMMPLMRFIAPTDPAMLSTLEAILVPPKKGGLVTNSLVYRYNYYETPDGLTAGEGTFNMCTFWLVEALTRAGQEDPQKLEEARLIFEQMLGYANHLGIYSEEIGINGSALGNTPQAFTHLGLISAAYNLDRALG